MPVARSDPRRATIVGIAGVMVGTVMILLVLFAGNLGDDSSHTTSSRSRFSVGPAATFADSISRDQTPLFFNDTATGSRPIVVHHLGTDAKAGWIAFDASVGDCTLTWHRETQDFTDCNGRRVPADGDDLHHYPVVVENGDVIVDLSVDATTTTSSRSS
ncbi:MAG: hypothetical protein QOD38_2014 [Acidimicrobiaceae bacterium]|jgi:hypothetical protein